MAKINQGIINSGSIGGNASVRIDQRNSRVSAGGDDARQLQQQAVLAEQLNQLAEDLRWALKGLARRDAQSAKRAQLALDRTLEAVDPARKADSQKVKVSVEELLDATKDVASAIPLAISVAKLIGGVFGFSL